MATVSEPSLELIERPAYLFEKGEPLAELDPVIQSILFNRGIRSEQDCETGLSRILPFNQLKDINLACELLYEALQKQQAVLVVGDFDADGATSTALALRGLRALGLKNVSYLVPDRFKFGYGLSPAIVDEAAKLKPDLILTVDNGISSIEGVEKARALGIKVLITDHHLPGASMPKANAIVNPNQQGCSFPSKNLAGVGVMFYVLVAFRAFLREQNYFEGKEEPNLASFLDVVALGTVVDLVPLDTNNRKLVQQGLARVKNGLACEGIKALIEVAKRNEHSFKSTDFAFALGPRINAAGRLDDMSIGIECLVSDDPSEAIALAQALNDFNEDRKQIEGSMKEEALALLPKLGINQDTSDSVICLFDERWHQGVVGIVASRLKELHHLPSIVFAQNDEKPAEIKGSARSVSGLHMRDLLDRVASQHPGLLKKFGGHAMAAGMTIVKDQFEIFKASLNEQIDLMLGEEKENILQARLYFDGALQTQHFNLEFAKTLNTFEPWGQQFPEPIFRNTFIIASQRVLSDKHLKMNVHLPDSSKIYDAIAFNVPPELWKYQGSSVSLLYKLDINEFRGSQSLQLMVEKIIPLNDAKSDEK
jgi:single-stranded-DNA-specific exonuclease